MSEPFEDQSQFSAADGLAQRLPDSIARLPPRQRLVLVWRYYEDRTFEEIAEHLQVKPATARSLLRHAVATVRKDLLESASSRHEMDVVQDKELDNTRAVTPPDPAPTELGEQQPKPPKWLKFVLYLFIRKSAREELVGDLEEEYREVWVEFGPRSAKLFYCAQVFASIWPVIGAKLERVCKWGFWGWLAGRTIG